MHYFPRLSPNSWAGIVSPLEAGSGAEDSESAVLDWWGELWATSGIHKAEQYPLLLCNVLAPSVLTPWGVYHPLRGQPELGTQEHGE